MEYPYFKGLEADRYSFYRVPKAMVKADVYKRQGYYVSVAKGLDVDKPRNLAKSVTVE